MEFNMQLNGRWFPQIVDIGTVGIYIQYILHSLVLIFETKCGGWFFISCFLRVLSKMWY